jgi:hypothetical protein
MENVRITLLEAYSDALNRVKKSPEGRRAVAYWQPLVTTRAGELACIQDAQSGDNKARVFLFIRSIPQLGSSLKKFLGPDSRASNARVRNGDDAEFVSEAMIILDQALQTYQPAKVTAGKSLINDFSMWIRNATMTQGVKLNRQANRGNMTGKVAKDDQVRVGSYDAHIEAGGDDVVSLYDAEKGTTLLDAWQTFVDDDGLDDGKEPTLRAILKFFLAREDFDVNAASKQFDKTNMTIRTKLSSMAPILQDHGISYEDFSSLIRTHGGKGLAKTL